MEIISNEKFVSIGPLALHKKLRLILSWTTRMILQYNLHTEDYKIEYTEFSRTHQKFVAEKVLQYFSHTLSPSAPAGPLKPASPGSP